MSARAKAVIALTLVGVVLLAAGWILRNDAFALALLVNLGAGALVVVGVSFVSLYLESRVRSVEQDIQDLGAAMGLRLPKESQKNRTLRALFRRWRARDSDFKRLEENPRADQLGRLLETGRRGGFLGRIVSVGVPETDVRLEVKEADSPADAVAIEIVGRSDASRVGLYSASLNFRMPRVLTWTKGQSFGDAMADVSERLRLAGLSRGHGDVFDSDGVLHSLVSTLRTAFGQTGNAAGTPSRHVIEVPNSEWAITSEAVRSLTGRADFPISFLWDDKAVERALGAASSQRESLQEAIDAARDVFWVLRPKTKQTSAS